MYMSIIPLALIVILILGAGYLMTKGDIKIPGFTEQNLEFRRLDNFPTSIPTGIQTEKQRLILKSREELDTFLASIDDSGFLSVDEVIDFDNEFVIAVSTQTREMEGYTLKIRRIFEKREDGTLIVSVRDRRPGKNCVDEEYSNISADLVAVSKTNKVISFQSIKDIYECDTSLLNL